LTSGSALKGPGLGPIDCIEEFTDPVQGSKKG
jgi:hypothetical protein